MGEKPRCHCPLIQGHVTKAADEHLFHGDLDYLVPPCIRASISHMGLRMNSHIDIGQKLLDGMLDLFGEIVGLF